ncbi:hypothetical protein E2C01_011919 [Portunus trituberculatus]|uniref:Uncharacterized protein n=1 Tax=Portunus trituberculatus TaxID=210409 RepID=A0A5B7DD86_PORTR|nr:hypothetical protein [Portunus trituberculatus]
MNCTGSWHRLNHRSDPTSQPLVSIDIDIEKGFSALLNEGLWKWTERAGVLGEEQHSFQVGRRAEDNLAGIEPALVKMTRVSLPIMFSSFLAVSAVMQPPDSSHSFRLVSSCRKVSDVAPGKYRLVGALAVSVNKQPPVKTSSSSDDAEAVVALLLAYQKSQQKGKCLWIRP